ncbi:TPA: hypothetical protein ACIJ1F_003755 [Citrobacter freundii]
MTALNKQAYRADGGDIGTGRLKEIAVNSYGDEEKRWLAQRVLALLDELEAAEKRIAELEARTVTLPQRLQPGADGYDDWYVHSADDGEYLKVDDVIEAIRAAGIGVKGE